MMIALAGTAVVCALSLILGFAARRAATCPLPVHRSTGITAAGKTTRRRAPSIWASIDGAGLTLPERWSALAWALLRPDRFTVAMSVWLALLDVVCRWPLRGRSRLWSTTRSGTGPSRAGWPDLTGCTRCPWR